MNLFPNEICMARSMPEISRHKLAATCRVWKMCVTVTVDKAERCYIGVSLTILIWKDEGQPITELCGEAYRSIEL